MSKLWPPLKSAEEIDHNPWVARLTRMFWNWWPLWPPVDLDLEPTLWTSHPAVSLLNSNWNEGVWSRWNTSRYPRTLVTWTWHWLVNLRFDHDLWWGLEQPQTERCNHWIPIMLRPIRKNAPESVQVESHAKEWHFRRYHWTWPREWSHRSTTFQGRSLIFSEVV